ncbi:hypothetical protein [Geitlerinema sp. PCC 7407]|uniref:hypothetical protein n=1 Tax=Geitlerinema sp. PCC 7407 TaxID=1173025 RepID=UPI00123722C4|nr:hypothetical protein [Geitlerinema sp. PCC 7407]
MEFCNSAKTKLDRAIIRFAVLDSYQEASTLNIDTIDDQSRPITLFYWNFLVRLGAIACSHDQHCYCLWQSSSVFFSFSNQQPNVISQDRDLARQKGGKTSPLLWQAKVALMLSHP